jgi:1-acyl-sn-glycerol-3-phosphate acyltransferase
MTLNGVVHEPGEWVFPYFTPEVGKVIGDSIAESDCMLLGRKQYEAWAEYWPTKTPEDDEFAGYINNVQKYVVSTTLFRKTKWRKQLFFPVRGRFYYQSIAGMFVNLIMGWWSMYPPFFVTGKTPMAEKRAFDKYSMRRLVQLCTEGAGNIIGFHPEGTRNKNDDPYTFLRPQPGVGKLIKEANPQVIPVFITGLGNNLPKQVLGNWSGGDKIRIHFGSQLDVSEFIAKKDHVRTYKEIGDFVMSKIGELAEMDRTLYGK